MPEPFKAVTPSRETVAVSFLRGIAFGGSRIPGQKQDAMETSLDATNTTGEETDAAEANAGPSSVRFETDDGIENQFAQSRQRSSTKDKAVLSFLSGLTTSTDLNAGRRLSENILPIQDHKKMTKNTEYEEDLDSLQSRPSLRRSTNHRVVIPGKVVEKLRSVNSSSLLAQIADSSIIISTPAVIGNFYIYNQFNRGLNASHFFLIGIVVDYVFHHSLSP